MSNESEQRSAEERVNALEAVLKLDDRLQTIEDRLGNPTRWWKNPKSATIIASVLASSLPFFGLINGWFTNLRESRRLQSEQQERIRQNYLDRVLRPGATEAEQERVFGLLSKLSSDRELQRWAQEELDKTKLTIERLKAERDIAQKERDTAKKQLLDVEAKTRDQGSMLTKEHRARIDAQQKLLAAQRSLDELNNRIEPVPTEEVNKCRILFSSMPPNATFTLHIAGSILDFGQPATTPTRVYVPLGSLYFVTFSKSGYKNQEISLDLRDKNLGCPGSMLATMEPAERK